MDVELDVNSELASLLSRITIMHGQWRLSEMLKLKLAQSLDHAVLMHDHAQQ